MYLTLWSIDKLLWKGVDHMRKRIGKIVCVCAIVTLAIIGIVIKARTKKDASTSQNQTAGMEAQNESYTEEKTMYFGTTTAGTDYEYFSSTATTPLQVEEVYAETGTQVTTQSAILKVTDESYKQAKKELEQNLKEAKRNLAQAKITYKEDVLSLQTEYNTESVVSDTAYETYETAVENLETELELAESNLNDANKILKTYPAKIENLSTNLSALKSKINAYKVEIKALNKKWKKAQKTFEDTEEKYQKLKEKKEENETVQNYIKQYMKKNGSKKEGNASDEASGTSSASMEALTKNLQEEGKIVNSNYKKAEQQYKAAEQKLEKIKTALESKKQQKETAENKMESCNTKKASYQETLSNAQKNRKKYQTTYEQAVLAKKTGILTAEKELQQNLLAENSASVSYKTQLETLTSTLDAAQKEYDEAKEQFDNFKQSFQDGIWYAQSSGLLQYIGYEAGEYISSKTPIAGYYNGKILSVQIDVEQEEIASIQVGQEVMVSMQTKRGVTGTVSKISSEQSASSASKVSYAVDISIENEDGQLESGETASILFQTKENQMENKKEEVSQ